MCQPSVEPEASLTADGRTLCDIVRAMNLSSENPVFDPAIIKRAEVVRAAELDRLPSYGDRDFPTFSEQFEAVLDAEPAAPRM